jgi:GntR family transcriptional regulator, carbon starvation induced regulator
VFQRLRADIISCRLSPGSALKFEALKESYSASFSTIREALAALTKEGLVLSEGRRGFQVAPVSRADLIDLTDARVLIERELIKLATENGGDEWEVSTAACLHWMEILEQRHGSNFALTEEWKLAHQRFHEALVEASGASTLLGVRANLYARAERYRSLSSMYRKKQRNKVDEHKAIMEAAFARKTERAQLLIERHIRKTTESVIEFAGRLLS